jgi:hypothetical protein
MSAWTQEQAQAYLARYKHVNEREIAELRTTPADIKLRQTAALMGACEVFGPDPDREREVRELRQRGQGLRETLGG